ncbi:unnamed protein product, partial [Candidula unifasciata]
MANQEVNRHAPGDILFLDRGDGNTALVHLHGATLLSWKCRGIEHLYLSQTAVFDNKKAIRGGVPVVFPNFGPWPLGPQHGFARIKRWTSAIPPTKHAWSVKEEEQEETKPPDENLEIKSLKQSDIYLNTILATPAVSLIPNCTYTASLDTYPTESQWCEIRRHYKESGTDLHLNH